MTAEISTATPTVEAVLLPSGRTKVTVTCNGAKATKYTQKAYVHFLVSFRYNLLTGAVSIGRIQGTSNGVVARRLFERHNDASTYTTRDGLAHLTRSSGEYKVEVAS
jgi:hypothetical protein